MPVIFNDIPPPPRFELPPEKPKGRYRSPMHVVIGFALVGLQIAVLALDFTNLWAWGFLIATLMFAILIEQNQRQ